MQSKITSYFFRGGGGDFFMFGVSFAQDHHSAQKKKLYDNFFFSTVVSPSPKVRCDLTLHFGLDVWRERVRSPGE